MNEEKHWNRIAPTYNDEIFDVFASDKNKKLKHYFDKHSNPRHFAIDFGCGNGKAFRYLSPRFKTVLGLDISQRLLNQASQLPYLNTALKQKDLTQSPLRLPKADFIFCCNVAILPEVEQNLAILRNISKALKSNGNSILVIPSLESMIYSAWRTLDWYKKEGVAPDEIDKSEFSGFRGKKTDILQGRVAINGVTTKHYTEPEIQVIFERCGLRVSSIEKIEYDWTSEFSDPPAWMKAPYPWDWLVECRKK